MRILYMNKKNKPIVIKDVGYIEGIEEEGIFKIYKTKINGNCTEHKLIRCIEKKRVLIIKDSTISRKLSKSRRIDGGT